MPTIKSFTSKIKPKLRTIPAALRPTITSLIRESEKNEDLLKDKQKLAQLAPVKQLLKVEKDKATSLSRQNRQLQNTLKSKTQLAANPVVMQLVAEKTGQLNTTLTSMKAAARQHNAKIQDLSRTIKTLQDKLKLADAKPKPLPMEEYNDFITRSVMDLKASLKTKPAAEAEEDDYELVISDIEFESTILPEKRGQKTGFIIPNREDLTSLPVAGLQKIRYRLTSIPKD